MITLGHLMVEILRNRGDQAMLDGLAEQVDELASAFPAYAEDFVGHV